MNTDTPIYIEESQVHQKNKVVMSLAVLLFLALFALSLYKWFVDGIRQPVEVFVYLMFAYVLTERAYTKTVCEVTDNSIRFYTKGLFGEKNHEVWFKDIGGIYDYKTKLLQVIKFRRTYRLNSALDNRPVWILAYRIEDKKGKLENRRIYFKASKQLLDILAEKMPNRVRVKEEQVILAMLDK